MITAGMGHVTPDWQLDLMYESESARMWAEQNAQPKEALDLIDPETLLNAWSHLDTAKTCDFDNALDWIAKTIDLLKDTPEADKLASIYDEVNTLSGEMMKIADKVIAKWEAAEK